jgi:hypothetical protein
MFLQNCFLGDKAIGIIALRTTSRIDRPESPSFIHSFMPNSRRCRIAEGSDVYSVYK